MMSEKDWERLLVSEGREKKKSRPTFLHPFGKGDSSSTHTDFEGKEQRKNKKRRPKH